MFWPSSDISGDGLEPAIEGTLRRHLTIAQPTPQLRVLVMLDHTPSSSSQLLHNTGLASGKGGEESSQFSNCCQTSAVMPRYVKIVYLPSSLQIADEELLKVNDLIAFIRYRQDISIFFSCDQNVGMVNIVVEKDVIVDDFVRSDPKDIYDNAIQPLNIVILIVFLFGPLELSVSILIYRKY
ncbi:hypothetical protein PoB_003823300 [Plakobranchus ocellatus]|uniref:Uncharacterized protein n=1 Tax=Plakobranchus ocellatus TaxID=259542 RepID=A0AAV4AZ10_9GAST|nr:hypothetical protein PoB_003823300 [Plakobranchus ocellatus]